MASKRLQELKEEIQRLESEIEARGVEVPQQGGIDWLLGIAAVALGFGLIIGLVVFLNYQSPAKEQARAEAREQAAQRDRERMADPAHQARMAVSACQEFVTSRLLDPDSARWIESPRVTESASVWTVQGVVVAGNRFGGMTDSHYSCRVTNAAGDWREISVTFSD